MATATSTVVTGGSGTGGSVSDLVRAVREEDSRVHLQLDDCIKRINLASLPTSCYPSSEAADKLAGLREKVLYTPRFSISLYAFECFVSQARRKHIARPFPFIEISEFLPSWASEVPFSSL
jgi:hypothetical protein